MAELTWPEMSNRICTSCNGLMKTLTIFAIAFLALEYVTAHKARTCQELAYLKPSLPDGEYMIQCAPNGKFKVYCHKTPNGEMQEFLTLPATGKKSKIFGNPFPVNSASYKCGQNCKDSNPNDSTLTTVYSKIRINPCTFYVDVTDTTFANTTGQIHDLGHETWGKITEPFAVAESCESGQDPGFANIDLTGTKFILNTTFETGGASPSGSTRFFDKQRAVVQADGYCGYRNPAGWTPYPASSRKPGHPQYVLKLALVQSPPSPLPINRDSCKVQGCGTYDPSRDDCHCDENCEDYQNCCSDYEKVCKTRDTCAVQGCGTYDPSRDDCHCDENCEDYQNCCSDYEKVCKTRDTCAVQGCGTYDPSRDDCHCDENCEDYQNCCSDYEKVCKTRDTCAVQGCGTYDPSRDTCHCDDNCEQYGNCCSDYQKVCRARSLCSVQGCGTYDRSDDCHCDENCEDYQNCCSDYEKVCRRNGSLCKVQGCGTYDPTRDTCHCDDNCEQYGNCCSDYEKVCRRTSSTFLRNMKLK